MTLLHAQMPASEAAWIRRHVFTPGMQTTYRTVPGFYEACACQYGSTTWCREGRHDMCVRGTPLRSYATVICGPSGTRPTRFTSHYRNVTDTSTTGPCHETAALVWLADRVCRWICDCTCAHATRRHQHADEPSPLQPIVDLQLPADDVQLELSISVQLGLELT